MEGTEGEGGNILPLGVTCGAEARNKESDRGVQHGIEHAARDGALADHAQPTVHHLNLVRDLRVL